MDALTLENTAAIMAVVVHVLKSFPYASKYVREF